MEIRKKKRDTVESLTNKIHFLRYFLMLICICFVAGICAILNYIYFTSYRFHHPLFELPSQFIFKLSVIGFVVSGLFLGMGTQLCRGGFIYHSVCGIPSNSAESWLTCFFIIIFTISIQASKNFIFSYLLFTENLYVQSLDDSIFISFGYLSSSFCILIVLCFFYIKFVNDMKKLNKTKRGIFAFIFIKT